MFSNGLHFLLDKHSQTEIQTWLVSSSSVFPYLYTTFCVRTLIITFFLPSYILFAGHSIESNNLYFIIYFVVTTCAMHYAMRDQYMAGKKYWKISHMVMVITSESIGFITVAVRPRVINLIFSQVMTITTRDIFQYFCHPYDNYIHEFSVK